MKKDIENVAPAAVNTQLEKGERVEPQPERSLRERLDTCGRLGALSVADLAYWLDLPYATVRSWRAGSEPQAARIPQVLQRLQWLEAAIAEDPRLPVPLLIRSEERRKYLKGIRGTYEREGLAAG